MISEAMLYIVLLFLLFLSDLYAFSFTSVIMNCSFLFSFR